jgi:predicted transcriptional regulator of viral defense system
MIFESKKQLGLGKKSRQQLSQIVRDIQGVITSKEVAELLKLNLSQAAKLLSYWEKSGWVSRIKRGCYIPVPLEASNPDISLEDPWIIASQLFSPCYIGGWSAAEYWDFTEQIYNSISVMTTRQPRKKEQVIRDTHFFLRTVSENRFFGTKTIWKGSVKLNLSDPTKTIIDMLDNPTIGGGIRPTMDMLSAYFESAHKNEDTLIEYARRMENGGIFKRLGFIVERLFPINTRLLKACHNHLTTGNVKIDLQLNCPKLVTKWRLWIPEGLDD